MKLRKIAAVLTAAAIAVTSAVVCPISAVAAEVDLTINSAIPIADLQGYSSLNVTYTAQTQAECTAGESGHTGHNAGETYCTWAKVPIIGVVNANDPTLTSTDANNREWKNGICYWYQCQNPAVACSGKDQETNTVSVNVQEIIDAFTNDKDWQSGYTLQGVLVPTAGWNATPTKVTATVYEDPVPPTEDVDLGTVTSSGLVSTTTSEAPWGGLQGHAWVADFFTKVSEAAAAAHYSSVNDYLSEFENITYTVAVTDISGEVKYDGLLAEGFASDVDYGWVSGVNTVDITSSELNKYTVAFTMDKLPTKKIAQIGTQIRDDTNFNKEGLTAAISYEVSAKLVLKAAEEYNITVNSNITAGTFEVPAKAAEGDEVTVKVTPNEGLKCDEILVIKDGGGTQDTIKVTPDENGSATFTMPAWDVTISGTFSEIPKPCTEIILDKTSISPIAGEEVPINATLTPADTTDTLTWSTSNNKVATVSETGVVTAVAPGTATITATCGDITAECKVDVKLPLTAISLSDKTASILVGNSKTLTVTYDPEDTTDDKTITWSTSDPAVATVADGKVTAVAAGTADITATCGEKKATCTVTVTDAAKPCTAVTLDKTAELEVGESTTLTATTTPADTTDELTWKTSDASVATVANGKVTAVAVGTAAITATCGDKTATCEVTVKAATKPCTKVELDKTTAELEVGKTTALKATTTPADTTDKVVWTTSDDKVATVANGTVTAVAEGKAAITATCGAKTATCEVTVKAEEKPQPAGDAIWEGSHDVGTAWGNALTIDKSRFADVKAGDTLRFTFTVGTAEYHQIQINDGNWVWKNLSCAADADPKYGSIGVKGTTYEFVLTAADAETFKTTGMVLNGYDVILSKVECVGTEGEILKPNGSTTAENENSEEAKKVPAANNTTVAADTAITSENVGSSDAATKTVSQQSAPVSGKYSQRFFMLIDEADVTKYDAVRIRISVTDSNGTVSGVFKTTKYYESIAIGGSEIKAPEGKVFIAFALKNIPDGATVNYSAITLEDRG